MPRCTSTSGCTAALAFNTLVSTADLAANLSSWRVFDCRHDLAKPELGEQQYRQAHIPGALFASLDRDLSAPKTGKNGRHPLLEEPGCRGLLRLCRQARHEQHQ